MKNDLFTVRFDPKTGGIAELRLNADPDGMNWVKPPLSFGVPSFVHNVRFYGADKDFLPVAFEETEAGAVAEFRTEQLQTRPSGAAGSVPDLLARTEYAFDPDGNLTVTTTIQNVSRWQKFFPEGDLGVRFNFYDDYYDAATCMTSRCSTHLWCGKDSTWVCALKMGESEQNLGLAFTRGGAVSYSQSGCKSNDRGIFTVNLDLKMLRPGESYVFSYVIFPHTGKADFLQRLAGIPHCAAVTADNFTCFPGEEFRLTVKTAGTEKITAMSDLPLLSQEQCRGEAEFCFAAETPGEHKITFRYGAEGRSETFAKVYVARELETILARRLDFIVEKQQYREEGNALDGAFLCYDSESMQLYYDEQFNDHNAQRERLGMMILLARHLREHPDEARRAALERALAFVYREVLDAQTGEVFNFAQRYTTWLRLYNYPWVALLLTEAYGALGGKEKLRDACRIMDAYYERGGKDFYPNGISVYELIDAFRNAGMKDESERLQARFLEHVERIIARGTNYPKHEVNYEQTIVTPAVSFILDAYALTREERYLRAVLPHLAVLERFDGLQPHYMLNNIAIRYWDDYWFGKLHLRGDTLPHYWSALSSIDYIRYAKATGDAERWKRGICGLRNCLCLFLPDGSASCARVYPFEVNGVRGERFDPLCNDQDFALYFAEKYLPQDSAGEPC